MPFCQAAATTRCCRMLGNEDRVPLHRRLATIVCWFGRGKSLFDKFSAMPHDQLKAGLKKIFLVLGAYRKARSGKSLEEFVMALHPKPQDFRGSVVTMMAPAVIVLPFRRPESELA